ncbi:MAG TPA: hypothetical protein VJA94_06910 [Candidatus Angelobacter sp.]
MPILPWLSAIRNLPLPAVLCQNGGRGLPPMIRQEQYEIWVQSSSSKWDILGAFRDLDLASAVAKNHSRRSRLICVTFEYGKMISQESVAELGRIA